MLAQKGFDVAKVAQPGAWFERIVKANVSGPHALQTGEDSPRHARPCLDLFEFFKSNLCECSSNDRHKGCVIGWSAETTRKARREQWDRGDIEAVVTRLRGGDTLHAKGQVALNDDGVTFHGDKGHLLRRYKPVVRR